MTASPLQDIILFRDEPLERLAECGDVPWLPPKDTVQSYRSLLEASIAPSPQPLPSGPGSWVPLMALATPALATAAASTRLQVEVFRKAFKPPSPGRGSRHRLPLVTRVTHDVASHVLATVNATALHQRLGAQRRGETTARALFKELKAGRVEGAAPSSTTPLVRPAQLPLTYSASVTRATCDRATACPRGAQPGYATLSEHAVASC